MLEKTEAAGCPGADRVNLDNTHHVSAMSQGPHFGPYLFPISDPADTRSQVRFRQRKPRMAFGRVSLEPRRGQNNPQNALVSPERTLPRNIAITAPVNGTPSPQSNFGRGLFAGVICHEFALREHVILHRGDDRGAISVGRIEIERGI